MLKTEQKGQDPSKLPNDFPSTAKQTTRAKGITPTTLKTLL